MDKAKKKSASKTTKKKATTKKTEKSAKKKKNIKNKNAKDDNKNNDNEGNNTKEGEIETVDQKEYNDKIEAKLNQPLTKKKLPPIQKNNNEGENDNNNEKEKIKGEEEVKEEEKIEEKKVIEKVELSIGTPHFIDIKGIKIDLEEKNKKITEANNGQDNYKAKLNNILSDLNKLLSENVDVLYNDEDDETQNKKQMNVYHLKTILFSLQQQMKDIKERNKLFKEHYEILSKRDKNMNNETAKEYEALIEEKKSVNNQLNKKIIELKSESRMGGKKLEAYSGNVKYPQDINNLINQLKTLAKKKADYFSKFNKNKKTLVICQKELENLKKVYEAQKKNNNYFNAKIEEEINRLNEDLAGNEEDIYNKVESKKAFIIKKQIHQEKVNSVFKISSTGDSNKLKIKKGSSFDPLIQKAIRYDVKSGYQKRRINIVAKMKSPTGKTYEKSSTKESVNINKKEKDILDEDDFSHINYDSLTEYEYRELLTKKEYFNDVTVKLEKSIKEADKMYARRIKEIKITLDDNMKKLENRKQENELLKTEIADLNKILALTEQEAKINTNKNLITNTKINTINTGEKELESQKEYLSPEIYQLNQNKKEKDLIPTHSNNELMGNEILPEFRDMNMEGGGHDILMEGQGGHKINNLGIKFPDLSNIEEDKGDKIMNNNNNEFNRSKAIDDIKKKYNIKKTNIEDNNVNDIDIDDNELNFDEINDEKLRKEQENIRKKEIEERERLEKELEDEKKFFKEHENILKGEEEGQFEPPIDNGVVIDNNNNNNDNDIEQLKDDEKNQEENMNNEHLEEEKEKGKNINEDDEKNNMENIEKEKDKENIVGVEQKESNNKKENNDYNIKIPDINELGDQNDKIRENEEEKKNLNEENNNINNDKEKEKEKEEIKERENQNQIKDELINEISNNNVEEIKDDKKEEEIENKELKVEEENVQKNENKENKDNKEDNEVENNEEEKKDKEKEKEKDKEDENNINEKGPEVQEKEDLLNKDEEKKEENDDKGEVKEEDKNKENNNDDNKKVEKMDVDELDVEDL